MVCNNVIFLFLLNESSTFTNTRHLHHQKDPLTTIDWKGSWQGPSHQKWHVVFNEYHQLPKIILSPKGK